MFENTAINKRILKRKNMMDELEKYKNENIDWKVKQLESKIYCLNAKYYPKFIWDSSKGTYIKKVIDNE